MADEEIEFTPQQKEAISHKIGHLRIIACAGSGKTEVISQRIANLIQDGVSAKNIVAFTFTVKAAEEMKSRIRKILDKKCPEKADFGDMYIGTIDAFCYQILQELDPIYKNYDMLDSAKRVAYVSKKQNFSRIDGWSLMNMGKSGRIQYYTTIQRFLYSIDLIMFENIDPERLTNEHMKKGYAEYRKMLEEDKYLDFPTTTSTLLHLLDTNERIRHEFQDRIRHLVVDEYQDVNKLQERLVEIVSEKAASVCVVGDDDQCIYQWRGSTVDNIISFKDRYSEKHEVTDIPLDENFRSTKAVIHTAREFIKHNSKRLTIKEMKHSERLNREPESGDIIHCHFDNEEQELQFILQKIHELVGTDFTDKRNNPFSLAYGDFAVLVRSNTDAAKAVNFLDQNGIKCIAYSGSTIFERDEVRLAMDCLAYLFRCKTRREGEEWRPPTLEELKEAYPQAFDAETYPLADTGLFAGELELLKKEVDKIFTKGDGNNDYLGDLGLQAVYHKMLSALGTELFDFGDVYNYNLAALSTAISDYEAVWIRLRASEVEGFFQFARAYGESNYMETQFADPLRIDAVKVMTIHKAKGLEFPVVFLPGMIKKRKPNPAQSFVDRSLYDADKYDGDEEDERRIYYTGFTRSEKYLFLSGAANTEGTKRPHDVHPFIPELDRTHISANTVLDRKRTGHASRLARQAVYATSFSELTTYDRCPHDFHLRNVFGYNAGVPAAFGYGTNIHNILNVIHNHYLKTGKVPDDAQIDKLIDRLFHLRYATKKIAENMKRGARRVIKNYIRIEKERDEFKKILETEKRFEFVLGDTIISGQIDLLKKVDKSGNVAEVEIIDFKTEGAADKPYQLDYDKQLRLYAIACLKSLGLSPQKATIHHLDRLLLGRKSQVDISPRQLEKTKDEINTTVQQIITKEFPAKPHKKLCSACDYRYLCHLKKFKAKRT